MTRRFVKLVGIALLIGATAACSPQPSQDVAHYRANPAAIEVTLGACATGKVAPAACQAAMQARQDVNRERRLEMFKRTIEGGATAAPK